MKRKIILAMLLLGISLVLSSCNKVDAQVTDILVELKAAPTTASTKNIVLPSLRGKKEISLSDYKGKLVYLNIWRSGCHFCQMEAPMLFELSRHTRENPNVELIGISIDQDRNEAEQFIRQENLRYPQLYDAGGETIRSLGYSFSGTPTAFIIDTKGELVGTISGYFEFDAQEKHESLKKLYEVLAKK